MPEINLMSRYPKTARCALLDEREQATEKDRLIARQFGFEYFDGPRKLGLGGYHYNPRFFQPVVEDFISHYGLTSGNSVLDIGCAKGFMLHDFLEALPGMTVAGVDVSQYCLDHAMPSVRPFLQIASCDSLPFPDKSFDLVIAIASIHNLDYAGVSRSLREITRVSRKHAFIKVNGYRNDAERHALERWNLVAQTILPVEGWLSLFEQTGYRGDYSWFTP
jgi:SAM-dependent methyltransferase